MHISYITPVTYIAHVTYITHITYATHIAQTVKSYINHVNHRVKLLSPSI